MSRHSGQAEQTRLTIPRWISLVALSAAALNAVGATVAGLNPTLLSPSHEAMTPVAQVYAGYLVSRNLALAITLTVLVIGRRPALTRMLAGMLSFAALVQILDAIVDSLSGRLILAPGLCLLAVALAWAALGLQRWIHTQPSQSASP